jgi:predicted DCC family thiol-disulfide oxidoreductase YuxK
MNDLEKKQNSSVIADQRVVFFDGYCNLCSGFIDFLIRRDRKRSLRFASLQGTTYRSLDSAPAFSESPESVVYWDGGRFFTHSTAALRVIVALGGIYSLALIGFLVPKGLRDAIYRMIARHRYQWFGKRDTCRVASVEELGLFLP